jgi:uncharacterized protein
MKRLERESAAGLLRFAPGIDLPIDLATEKVAFMGRTGSGKTYAAKKFTELLLEYGAQVIVLDPVGVWYGLRVPGDGEGFGIPVFGGLHGDIPLDPTAGRLFAELVFERNISAVFDVSQLIDSEMHRFVSDFCERLFELQRSAPRAVHIVMDECQHFIPQEKNDVPSKMVNRVRRFCMVGRNFGIGVSMISQAPQSVDKRCLNLAGKVFVYQTKGKHERGAVDDWLVSKGLEFDTATELPKLAPGNGYLFGEEGEPQPCRAYPLRTRDTSSTPKVGEARRAVSLTPIELHELKTQMTEVVEQAEASDPKKLKARIHELEKKLAARPPVVEETSGLGEGELIQLRNGVIDGVRAAVENAIEPWQRWLEKRAVEKRPRVVSVRTGETPPPVRVDRLAPPPPMQVTTASIDGMSATESALLMAWAVYGPMSLSDACIVSLYSSKSSGPNIAAAHLRRDGLIMSSGKTIGLSPKGTALAKKVGLPPKITPDQLLAAWQAKLPECAAHILGRVVETSRSKRTLSLAGACEGRYSMKSSGPNIAIAGLRKGKLVSGPNSLLMANELFVRTTRRGG